MKSTDFLFARPSFMRGIAKILDMGSTGKIYNSSESEAEADYKALLSDWNVTGNDMREAMNDYQKRNKKELKAAGFRG